MGWICPAIVFLVGALVAAIPTLFAVLFYRRAAAVAGMRLTRVGNLRRGVVKVKGRVVAQESLLTSPLGRRPCVYYRFVVEEMRRTGGSVRSGGGSYWETVIDDKQGLDVLIEDETGQVEVRLEEADVELKSEQSQTTGTFDEPPERLRRVLEDRYGRSTRGLLFNRTLRYTETSLEDGARVVAVGAVEGGRGGVARLASGSVPLMVSDKGAKKLGGPYRRRALYCLVGAGVILLFFGFLTFMAADISGRLSNSEEPTRNGAAPGPDHQPPPGP